MSNKANKIVLSTRDNPWQSASRNTDYYMYYYDLLYQVAAATMRWEGLPDEIDRRFVNMTLFSRGLATFFWLDEYDKYFMTMSTPSGALDVYNNPLSFTCFGAGNFHHRLSRKECVPVWLNYRRTSAVPIFRLYARRLASIDRTIEVNLAQHKTPAILQCDEQQRLTLSNLVKQWQGGEPVIFGNEGFVQNFIELKYITNDAPYLVDKLYDAKRQCFNEFLTIMGVDNSPVDKAERVQSAEVASNNVEIGTMRLTRLDTIREACREINRRYGLSVWVDFNQDFSSENWEIVNSLDGGADWTMGTTDYQGGERQ